MPQPPPGWLQTEMRKIRYTDSQVGVGRMRWKRSGCIQKGVMEKDSWIPKR